MGGLVLEADHREGQVGRGLGAVEGLLGLEVHLVLRGGLLE